MEDADVVLMLSILGDIRSDVEEIRRALENGEEEEGESQDS
ncbi:MAG TPA: hypothetical protein VGH52_00615 [Gaiellaceae bacterium]